MGDAVTTMSAIVVANAILLPLAAYGCMRLGLLPGVDWHWPFQRQRDGNHDLELFDLVVARSMSSGEDEPVQVANDGQLTDTLMQSADGKLYLIPFPLEPFEVRDQADILELRREAHRVPPRDITSVRLLPARSAAHARASLNLSRIAAHLAAKRSAPR